MMRGKGKRKGGSDGAGGASDQGGAGGGGAGGWVHLSDVSSTYSSFFAFLRHTLASHNAFLCALLSLV